MPTYRRPKYLRRAMLSVLGQTYKNIQISVFDNASGDGTKDTVKSLSENDERIKYHCHSNNIGMLNNFKYAFESVDTPYFAMLTDDDLLAKDCYQDALNVLENNPDIMFVILDTVLVDEDMNLVGAGRSNNANQLVFYRDESRFDAVHSESIPLTCIAMVFRKEVAQIYLDMDDRFDVGSDIRFIFYAAARYNFATLSKVGAFVTIHSGSFSVVKNNFNLVHEGVQISRYIEIFHDERVAKPIRDRAVFYISKLLTSKRYKSMVVGAMIRLIYNYCKPSDLGNEIIELDIISSKDAGYLKTSIILNFLYQSAIIEKVVRLVLSSFLKKRSINNKLNLLELENGIYKEVFDSVSDIKLVEIK